MLKKNAKTTQVQGKPKKEEGGKAKKKGPCPYLCDVVPINVPGPKAAQHVLHPKKDVFVLKVAKVGANGDRRSKMELELVTEKGVDKRGTHRVDTRETQCDPDPPPCNCCKYKKCSN